MLRTERTEGLTFVSVPEQGVGLAVERLKSTLPDEPRECGTCGYVASTFRWGIKTCPAEQPRRIALVLCCPDCESPTDLHANDANLDGRL